MTMKKIFQVLMVIFICLTTFSSHAEDYRKLVPHIDAQKAFYLYNSGRMILLDRDAGNPDQRRSKIVGAIYRPATIPVVKLKLPKKKLIGVFCEWGKAEGYSASSVYALRKKGHRNVAVIKNGTQSMIKAGFMYRDVDGIKQWQNGKLILIQKKQ